MEFHFLYFFPPLKCVFCFALPCFAHSGNNGIHCTMVLESIDRGNVTFIGAEQTSCLSNQTYHWFNSTDPLPIRQLEKIKQLNENCPSIPGKGNCTCRPERMPVELREDKVSMVLAPTVDCSNLGLTSLPKTLPWTTISLNVSNNSVSMSIKMIDSKRDIKIVQNNELI